MRKSILAAGVAVAVFIPSLANAQQSCETRSANKTTGTVIGAVAGALLGRAIDSHGSHAAGTIVGGVGGAIAGNAIAGGKGDCSSAYGYYDSNGLWHANAVAANNATGYYDRDNRWVAGQPNGYYDANGRWVSSSSSEAGYTDSDGHWVPASASGYYDADGRWVAGAAPGYYDRGRWVAGPVTGYYDRDGRWIRGSAPGHRDASGVWIADAQPGYYDRNGRWNAGQAYGYYDARGNWVATSAGRNDSASNGRNDYAERRSVADRLARLDERIRDGKRDGSLTTFEAQRARADLRSIASRERNMRHYNGRLSARDEADIQARLDRLSTKVRMDRRQEARNGY